MKPCASSAISQAWAAELRNAQDITGIRAEERVSDHDVRMKMVKELSRHGGARPAHKQIARKGAASAHQEALMHTDGPLFIEGRSGTGKTTVVCGRLALKHQAAKERGEFCRQLFVTRSSMLRDEVHRILEAYSIRGARLTASGHWTCPVLATWDELLCHICSCCGLRFEKLPRAMSFECFCTSVLPQLRHVSSLSPHLLWAEFLSRLSGPTTPSLHIYQQQSGEFSATGIRLLPDDLKHIFAAFNEYKAYKTRHALFDDADLAAMLVQKMQKAGCTPRFHELLVDEVQDFTPGQCSLLLALCSRPEGICFAGDTAQTITNGCGFTFDYLRDLVREKFYGVDPPATVHLGVNYRSTQGIVALAKAQVQLLEKFFPGTVDPIAEGTHHKPFSALPVFVSMKDVDTCTDCVAVLQGQVAQLDPAHFLVVVRSDPQRQALRQGGLNATILTVEEAKGLERDVVIVVDFFRDCPMPHAGLLWNFPRAALPMDSSKGYRTEGGESRIAWLLQKQTEPAGLRSLGKKERRELYALAPAVLEMKHLYVADTRAAGQLVHVERGTRLAQHMLQYYAHSGGLVEHLGADDLGGHGIVSHPSVATQVAAHGGPSLDHVLNVAQKSVELFQHAADDAQKNAVYGEAARTFKESADELRDLPSNSDLALLLAALTDMKHLAEGHWYMRFQKMPQQAAPCYLAAKVTELAGEAFSAAGDHLRAAACLLHTDYRAASSHLRDAGCLGRSMVVLLCSGGADEALAEADAYLQEATASGRLDTLLMTALQQSFLESEGAAWLVAERGRENVLREWFCAALQHGDLEPWSEELIEGIPSLASLPFAAAASAVVKKYEAQRILRHCRQMSERLDPALVVAGAFSAVAQCHVGPLLVLANALPAYGAHAGMRLEAAFGALEAVCASKLHAGSHDLSVQLQKCLTWCGDNLPGLSEAEPPSARWTLARILLASTPGQLCVWDDSGVESWEDIGTDVLYLRDEIAKVLSPEAVALSNSTSTLQALCKRETRTREALNSITRDLRDILRDITLKRKAAHGPWVRKSLVAPGATPDIAPDASLLCPGTVRILDQLRWILESRDGVIYQWFRFVPLEVRGKDSPGVQLGELVLSCSGRRVDASQCEIFTMGGDSPKDMGPEKAFDGKADSQWRDCKMGGLVLRFDSPTAVDSYSIKTAGSNNPECDPVSWRFEGSQDGECFVRLHEFINDDPEKFPTKERYAEIGNYPVTVKDLPREVREFVGETPNLMRTLCHEDPFTEWIAQEVAPVVESTLASLCRLLPFADVINRQKNVPMDGVRKAVQLIRSSSLMQKHKECQAALVRALRDALSSGTAPAGALSANATDDTNHTPVFNIPLLHALAPQFCGSTVKEEHLQQIAAQCLQWPASSM